MGNHSTSSARYQDDVFNENACPPEALVALGKWNRDRGGIVEAYIYAHIAKKHAQLSKAMEQLRQSKHSEFDIRAFVGRFHEEPGLKRSIDKVFEILVYSLFTVLVQELRVTVTVSVDQKRTGVLREFEDFARSVIRIDTSSTSSTSPARLYRVGVCNAADRGLDMWANFGPAVQVKHLSLDTQLAASICGSISADRIVIVCRETEAEVIKSVLNQVGFWSRIQSVVTDKQLYDWYDKALRGKFSERLGPALMATIMDEMEIEFPGSGDAAFQSFMEERGYDLVAEDPKWRVSGAGG